MKRILALLLLLWLVASQSAIAQFNGGNNPGGFPTILPDPGTDTTKYLGTNGNHGFAMVAGATGSLTTSATKTGNFSAAVGNAYVVDSTSGAVVVALPDATLAANKGGTILVHSISGGAGSITFTTVSAQTINGQAAAGFDASQGNNSIFVLISDGANWTLTGLGAAITANSILGNAGGVPQAITGLTWTSGTGTLGMNGVSLVSSGTPTITLPAVTTTEPAAQTTTNGGILNATTAGVQSYTNDAQFSGTSGSTLTLGKASSATGILNFNGTTSGTTALTVPAAAGSVTITLPTVTTTGPTAQSTTTGSPLVATSAGVQSYPGNVLFTGTGGATLSLGKASSATGALTLIGTTSGSATLTVPATAGTPTFNLNSPGSGTSQDIVPVGGNGSDGAGTWGTNSLEGQQFNFTTLTTTNAQNSQCAGCVVNASGAVTIVSGSFLFGGPTVVGSATGIGIANAGGTGAASASVAGLTGWGPSPGQGAASGAVTQGPGGGAGAASPGGNGGGTAAGSSLGLGGLNGGGTSHYSGQMNGSGGGGGASGASGTGGNGGGGSDHITIIAAGGFAGTGTIKAAGDSGAAGVTLGSGGGGGGGGSVWLYGGSGNLPALVVTVVGGAGGASVSTAVNSGGGGGGYIGGSNAGTIASATFTVTGGAAGTGGSGAAGSAGGAGLANMRASIAPTLPAIVFDHMNGDQAGKNMCWILLARRFAMAHLENESEQSHIFIWDGEKNQHRAPLTYVAATYSKQGAFDKVYTALMFGGDKSVSELCDDGVKDECKTAFDTFKDSPIKGEMPRMNGEYCGGLDSEFYGDRT